MATKRQELWDPNSCLSKAGEDEELFVLRAQDLTAPERVDEWALKAQMLGASPEKVAEARACANRMREQQGSGFVKAKRPD